jgi:HSP20 family molecular chaperone IbpA
LNERDESPVIASKRMNTKIIRNLFVSAVAMTFAPQILFSAESPSPSPSATAQSSPAAAFTERMQQLDRQLDSLFSDTFRGFGNAFGGSAFASSIDLRDQKDKYVVRVYVPDANTSQVNAKVEGDMLHITATGQEKTKNSSQRERYEQMISLPGPVPANKMQIERKPNLVVVKLPKDPNATTAASRATSPSGTPFGNNFAGIDQNIIQQMARMQRQMTQMFDQAFPGDENGLTSDFADTPFGSAVHVDDLKDKYVVHFNLPSKNLQDVNVQLESGELHLTASKTAKNQTKNSRAVESSDYVQVLTLPGPVQKNGMKVERQNGTIVVTLPKAQRFAVGKKRAL